jgi:D-beta-D-heptose 7-phosphate kinase/D-beta-D-heptose 1-phosphate adenosyltransferase
VLTNGCFDILHPGHIHLLQEAKKLGNFLIVAINSDNSVNKLKGSGRPFNRLSSRIKMLTSLACVDLVISFNEISPENIIKKISPDILVKGGDYKVNNIIGG